MNCYNQNCNQGRACPARNQATTEPSTATLIIDSRNIPQDEAKDLLKVWRKHKGVMTVKQARKELVPSNIVLALKTLWYIAICAGVLFVVFVPLALLGLFIGLVLGWYVIGQAKAFDKLLPAGMAHCQLEVIQ